MYCKKKKGLNIEKKSFLTEQVSAIIKNKILVKYQDLGCPTISVTIRETHIKKALLDLGDSVHIVPYNVTKKFGLGEIKPTNITLSLADKDEFVSIFSILFTGFIQT